MEQGRHRERVISWAGALSVYAEFGGPMALRNVSDRLHADLAEPREAAGRRLARKSRTRNAVLRYLAVWSWVAAMALIAQAFAPSVS